MCQKQLVIDEMHPRYDKTKVLIFSLKAIVLVSMIALITC